MDLPKLEIFNDSRVCKLEILVDCVKNVESLETLPMPLSSC